MAVTGGKSYLASRIVSLFPKHLHYCEPFFGGGAVLLARDPDDERLWIDGHKGVSEVVNDISARLTRFWRVLQSDIDFARFLRIVEAMPMSRTEWDAHHDADMLDHDDEVVDAVSFFVDCRQSRSGMMKDFTSITRSRTRRQMNGNVSEWLGAVDGLPEVHARLRRVLIENMDAIKLIEREDTPNTLYYIDPPYLHETRSTKDLYDHEMSESDHVRLLDVLRRVEGKVMLSGYPSELYRETLADWRSVAFNLPNNLAGGKSKARETEMLWMNF